MNDYGYLRIFTDKDTDSAHDTDKSVPKSKNGGDQYDRRQLVLAA
jgi:hypothetical protein